MKLNTLKADGFKTIKWCGPVALALITGRTLRYCHNKLAKIKGVKPRYLKGVWNSNMRVALDQMGYEVCPVHFDLIEGKRSMHMPTLANWINKIQTTEQFRAVVLVNVTNHYVVAHKGMVAENKTDGKAFPAVACPSARKRINEAWIVRRKRK